MTVPDCVRLPDIPEQLAVTFPGASELATIQQEVSKIPSVASLPFNLMSQAGPIMVGVKPIFTLVKIMKAIKECQEAIPKAITQMNPKPIIDCVPNLFEQIENIIKFIPQLAVPLMAKGLIDTVITVLDGLVGFLEELGSQSSLLAERIERAANVGDPALDEILECADEDLSKSQENSFSALEPVAVFIDLVNDMLEEIGIPPIDISDASGDVPLEDTIGPIREIVDFLKTVRDSIPF